MESSTEFADLDAFYLDDPRRWTSREADYGVMWRDAGFSRFSGPQWRVSYIQATGEVYALSSRGPVRVLGVVPADDGPDWNRTLRAILGNWADPAVNDGFNLTWVAGRLREAACSDACPLGYAPGLASPCRASGRCARRARTPHM